MTAAAMPRLTEAQFLRQVTELAEIFGWGWSHFRPAMTTKGWRTPVSGPLGKGWPDLVLVRESDRRLVFAELKGEGGRTTTEQDRVLDALRCLEGMWDTLPGPTIEVKVWRPDQWPEIEATLR